MVTKEDMAKGYVEQVRSQLNQLKNQVAALEQHIQECEEGLSDESPPESEQNHPPRIGSRSSQDGWLPIPLLEKSCGQL